MEILIANRFSLRRQIGSGCFGDIFLAHDKQGNRDVALKLEKNRSHGQAVLKEEADMYKQLENVTGVPRMYWFGVQSNYNILAIDLLSSCLEDRLQKCGGRFSLKTVLMLADQMISCLQGVHGRGIIHRDLKPENFMIGTGKNFNAVFMIDFGLSKPYIDPKTKEHIPYKEKASMTGTARYASINCLKEHEQGRRDDMESLAYIFIYFLKGKLPWQGLPGRTKKERFDNILNVKQGTEIEVLCDGLPKEFPTFLKMVKNLDFTEEPDYSMYRTMFRDLFVKQGFIYDYKYDWLNVQQKDNNKEKEQKEEMKEDEKKVEQKAEVKNTQPKSEEVIEKDHNEKTLLDQYNANQHQNGHETRQTHHTEEIKSEHNELQQISKIPTPPKQYTQYQIPHATTSPPQKITNHSEGFTIVTASPYIQKNNEIPLRSSLPSNYSSFSYQSSNSTQSNQSSQNNVITEYIQQQNYVPLTHNASLDVHHHGIPVNELLRRPAPLRAQKPNIPLPKNIISKPNISDAAKTSLSPSEKLTDPKGLKVMAQSKPFPQAKPPVLREKPGSNIVVPIMRKTELNDNLKTPFSSHSTNQTQTSPPKPNGPHYTLYGSKPTC